MKKTIEDLELKDKKVLLRADFNVPLDDKGKITDTTRIDEEIPTINYLLDCGAKVIVCSHLGRPEGKINEKYSLKPVYEYLEKVYPNIVKFSSTCIGKEPKNLVKKLRNGEILLLENLRFRKEEEQNDEEFEKKLAGLADIYVNDAFGTAHRKHASTYGVAKFLPSAIGYLMKKEIDMLSEKVKNPEHPFVAILGGVKVKDKIKTIENLLSKADTVIIGGALLDVFLVASGKKNGSRKIDEEEITFAKDMIKLAKKKKKELVLAVDFMCAKDENTKPKCYEEEVPEGLTQYDIGKKSIKLFKEYIKNAKLIVWNGPIGYSEKKHYGKGTKEIAKAIAKSKSISIVGGGNTVEAINKYKLKNRFSHVSTGGGASLKLLEGSSLAGVEIIEDK